MTLQRNKARLARGIAPPSRRLGERGLWPLVAAFFGGLMLHSLGKAGQAVALLGLVPLLLWLGTIGARVLRWTLRSGFTFPLSCLFGYLCTALTVPGFDPGYGIYLGIGLTATLPSDLEFQK